MAGLRLRVSTFEIDLRWWLLASALAAIAVRLGVWQLDRAGQKIALQDAYYDRVAMAPISCAQAVAMADPAFVRVRLDGRFEPLREYLLDNRTFDAVAGYEVLTPFRCADGTRLIVNRGWISPGASRDIAPRWSTPSVDVQLTGFVYVPTGLPPLVNANDWPVSWPTGGAKRIGYLDAERIHSDAVTGQYRYPIFADAPGSGVFEPNYSVESVSPNKHWGYAVQWFAIAVAILAYLGYRSLRRL